MGDTQDIRLIGGLYISCPVTRLYFVGSSLALCGFPFLSGFYSKDLILEVYFILRINSFMYVIIFLSTIFTLTYSVRLVYYIFFNSLGYKTSLSIEEEEGMILPMRFLFMLSIYAGGMMRTALFPVICVMLPVVIRVSVLVCLLGLSYSVYTLMGLSLFKALKTRKILINYLGTMWFLPGVSTILFIPVLKLGQLFLKFIDQG